MMMKKNRTRRRISEKSNESLSESGRTVEYVLGSNRLFL